MYTVGDYGYIFVGSLKEIGDLSKKFVETRRYICLSISDDFVGCHNNRWKIVFYYENCES